MNEMEEQDKTKYKINSNFIIKPNNEREYNESNTMYITIQNKWNSSKAAYTCLLEIFYCDIVYSLKLKVKEIMKQCITCCHGTYISMWDYLLFIGCCIKLLLLVTVIVYISMCISIN